MTRLTRHTVSGSIVRGSNQPVCHCRRGTVMMWIFRTGMSFATAVLHVLAQGSGRGAGGKTLHNRRLKNVDLGQMALRLVCYAWHPFN